MATLVSLPVGAEVPLAVADVDAGARFSITLDRTVSPNAVSAPSLNALDGRTKIYVTVLASADGVKWRQILAGTVTAGKSVDPDTGKPADSSGLAVSVAPGEKQIKVAAQVITAAAVQAVGCGMEVSISWPR